MDILKRLFSKKLRVADDKTNAIEILRTTPLLDPIWYRQTYADLRDTPIDIAHHYLEHGAAEGRNPHPLFDTKFYLKQNPDVAAAGTNPLIHFLGSGASEGRNPCPLFNTKFFLDRNPQLAESGENPLIYYISHGASCDPHPLFITKFYLEQNPDVFESGVHPLIHYITYGAKEGRNPHPLFNTDWYLKQNPEVAAANSEPLAHYLEQGSADGCYPNRLFDPSWYRVQHPDVAAAGIEPLIHYYGIGYTEGRRASPLFDPSWYLAKNPEVLARGIEPLAYYLSTGSAEDEGLDEYVDWIRLFDTIDHNDRKAIQADIIAMKAPPLISIIMPVYETPERYLRAAIDSVREQLYPHWELCIADDASTAPHIRRVLEYYNSIDSRIKILFRSENGHISTATNSALSLADGDFIALLDHDDALREHALYMVAALLVSDSDIDLIYSDEDRIDSEGRRYNPYFKSDWNPDLMLAQNMFCHLGVYRKTLIEKIGGFRRGYDGSQDYDLILRAQSETSPNRIRHIPHVLYHWRAIPGSAALNSDEAKPYALNRARLAIADHLENAGIHAEVLPSPHPAFSRIRYPIKGPLPYVTIILTNCHSIDSLHRCIEGLLNRTDYSNFEILITDVQSEGSGSYGGIATDRRVRIIPYDGKNNLSEICNFAASRAGGSLLCFLDSNMQVINSNWLTEMVSQAVRPGVGAVGALLYLPDGRIKHAGLALGFGSVVQYVHQGLRPGERGDYGYFGRAAIVQNVSAVTGACLVMTKLVLEEIQGFNDKDLPAAFSDVDLCLRVREAGYRIVWTPHAELYDHSPASTSYKTTVDPDRGQPINGEINYMLKRWGHLLDQDPSYNPNLRLNGPTLSLAFPPRIELPWRSKGPSRQLRPTLTDEGRMVAASGLFNFAWYLSQNPDVLAAGIDPLEHYLGNGSIEGRFPNPAFDPAWYREEYPDIAAANVEPLTHYVTVGSKEGRRPNRLFDPAYYREQHPDVAASGMEPLAHYLLTTSVASGMSRSRASDRLTDFPTLHLPDFFELRGITPRGAIAVVLHLYYPDLWDEMRTAIQRISQPFDIFVSLVKGVSEHMRNAIKKDFPEAYVFEFVEDRGRDIARFLALVQTGVLFRYELVCKLHSKRSPYVPDGDGWRRALIDGILGSTSQIEQIISSFRSDPELGIVVADGNIYGKDEHWSGNEKFLDELLPRIGISTDVKGRRFPGGGIFWIRPLLLRTFAGIRLNLSDIEPEPMPWNGALGHALERMYGLICEDAGMRFAEWSEIKETAPPPPVLKKSKLHIFAFYLPQFHPIPENNQWWGSGFTEWTNVTKAKPLYAGHRQPRLPGELGFCDLRVAETREAQAMLAREYGLSGFCYYYYWFNGRRLLERPLEEVLASGSPDFPFLICWANEPWSRNWDGLNHEVLLPQTYDTGWVRRFAHDIAPLLQDQRYFRLDGKPMVLIYRIQHIPESASAMYDLRNALADEGIAEIHLGAVWSHFPNELELPEDPTVLGFDSYCEFPPHRVPAHLLRPRPHGLSNESLHGLYDYNRTVTSALAKLDDPVTGLRHRCVMAGFDNTARRGENATVFHGATPTNFRRWLRGVILHERSQPGERVVFINAWNEWAEGTCLEPDADFGRGWLEAVFSAAAGA